MTYNSKGVQYMKIYDFFPFVGSAQLGSFHLNMEPMCKKVGQLKLLSKLLFFNLIHFCTMYSTFCFY
jgi:hypothetical protein